MGGGPISGMLTSWMYVIADDLAKDVLGVGGEKSGGLRPALARIEEWSCTELNPACVEEVSAVHRCSPQEASSQQASATLLLGPASQMCLVFSVHGVGIYFPGSCS